MPGGKSYNLIVCPLDRAPLQWLDDLTARCGKCGNVYPVRHGILSMEPEPPDDPHGVIAQTIQTIRNADQPVAERTSIRDFSHRFGLETIARAHLMYLEPYLRGATGLDDGCGLGLLLTLLSPETLALYGLDFVAENLQRVKSRSGLASHIDLVQGSGLRLPFPSDSMDFVCSSEVIEHVPDPALYLREIVRVLKPGGVCTVSTPNAWMYILPNPTNLKRAILHPALFLDVIRPEKCWAEALPSHPALRPSVLRLWCKNAGLRVLKHRGVLWPYFCPEKWSLERGMSALDRRGFPSGRLFASAVRAGERALEMAGPLSRCLSVRQIVLARKPVAEETSA